MAERFIRTIKEQVIYGRVFQNPKKVWEAVRHFVDTNNCVWLMEKKGFKSSWQARAHVARPSLTYSSGLIKTRVQETGCDAWMWT